jgi:hypothetical protein
MTLTEKDVLARPNAMIVDASIGVVRVGVVMSGVIMIRVVMIRVVMTRVVMIVMGVGMGVGVSMGHNGSLISVCPKVFGRNVTYP